MTCIGIELLGITVRRECELRPFQLVVCHSLTVLQNGIPESLLVQNSVDSYKLAAASIAPIPLNVLGLVTTISTGYFHSMNDFQPQYANFLPKYFPRYGTMTSDRSSSSCCSDSCHSRSASEFASERVREAVSESSEEGRESRSSSCVCEGASMIEAEDASVEG